MIGKRTVRSPAGPSDQDPGFLPRLTGMGLGFFTMHPDACDELVRQRMRRMRDIQHAYSPSRPARSVDPDGVYSRTIRGTSVRGDQWTAAGSR